MAKYFLLFLIPTTLIFSQQNTTPMIAVSDLVGQGVNQNEANTVTEQLRAELYKTGHFRIIERSQMQEILKEQGFQQSGCTNDSCAVQAGQLLGVGLMVVGTMGRAGSYIVLSLRIIDVQTGEVLVTESVQVNGGVDKIIEGGIRETAEKVVAGFSNAMSMAMVKAAEDGVLAKVDRILQWGVDVNTKDTIGITPLDKAIDQAALNDHVDVVKLLLRRCLDVNAKDKFGMTPLQYAVFSDHEDVAMIDLLLAKGANINTKDESGETPLHKAVFCSKDSLPIVRLLIKKGAEVVAIDKLGETPLHVAADRGYAAVANLLVGNGANVRTKEIIYGDTPLHLAAKKGHVAVALLLIKRGAIVDERNNSDDVPLHYAADYGHEDVAKILIDNGANINAKNKYGFTPLKYALSPDDSLDERFNVARNSAGRAKIVKLLRIHDKK